MTETRFERFRALVEDGIPFNKQLGLKLEEMNDGTAQARFDYREELVGNPVSKVLHGGVISAVLDVVGACAVMSTFDDNAPLMGMGTVDMRIDFLRPGAGRHFIATGQVMRPGRILCASRMELHNDEAVLIAIGTAIYRVSRHLEQAPPNL